MNWWFTADTHFGHKNIIEHSKRPFSSVEEMDETLIKNWNAVVKKGDFVYHLGDFSWNKPDDGIKYLNRLAGTVCLIRGNHEPIAKCQKLQKKFHWIKDLHMIQIKGQEIVLCHYAMQTWNKKYQGSWHLFGHSHGKIPTDDSFRMDVGVDCHNYEPISFDFISSIMSQKRGIYDDHQTFE